MITVFEQELEKGTGVPYLLLKKGCIQPSEQIEEILYANIIENNVKAAAPNICTISWNYIRTEKRSTSALSHILTQWTIEIGANCRYSDLYGSSPSRGDSIRPRCTKNSNSMLKKICIMA